MSNITEVSRPTQWKPGQSGNLNGRPVGTRQAFSAGFLRDLAEVWSDEGRETMVKTARTNPAVFFATCARLIPNDVRVTVQQQLPGNLSAEDWAMMRHWRRLQQLQMLLLLFKDFRPPSLQLSRIA